MLANFYGVVELNLTNEQILVVEKQAYKAKNQVCFLNSLTLQELQELAHDSK